jgi:pimeloyl-ACP methyl ester carboxylesterase
MSGIVRLVVGNPLIMMQMVRHVTDAGSYAPVTILVEERSDGVHLSYDRMASFLSPYGSAEALKVAEDLDAKVQALLATAGGFGDYFTEDLKKIEVPTLILHGDDDQMVPIADSALLSAKLIKGATLKVIPGAPHGMCSTLKAADQ